MLSRKTLLKKVHFPTTREKQVLRNLRNYGAPLSTPGLPGLDLTLEEALTEGLVMARRFPFVAQVWPVMYARNREVVDLDSLEKLALAKGHGDVLGFFLNVSRLLTQDPTQTDTERRLMAGKAESPEDFFLLDYGPRYRALAELRSPLVARDWNFRMLTTVEHFQETFDTFVG